MDWSTAETNIRDKVKVNTNLNTPKSTYRYVESTDTPLYSDPYNYHGEIGFVIPIGERNKIKIPWSMLRNSFNALCSSTGYSGRFFRKEYRLQAEDHPCHVHVIGQIFVAAQIAYQDGDTYRLKKD